MAAAHVVWLYLDYSRRLKLPSEVQQEAPWGPPGEHQSHVTITDDPPGKQWIVVVASRRAFDAAALRDELQAVVDGSPPGTALPDLIPLLEQALAAHPDLDFRGHSFEVPVTWPP